MFLPFRLDVMILEPGVLDTVLQLETSLFVM